MTDLSRSRPLVGITCNIDGPSHACRRGYADAVLRAGGLPLLLPAPDPDALADADLADHTADLLARLDAVVTTGGDDPIMEPFGEPTHPAATPVHPDRQRFELAIARRLVDPAAPPVPALAVCLGMQYLALATGGTIRQHLHDELGDDAAEAHRGDRLHAVAPPPDVGPGPGNDPLADLLPAGTVNSHHHQAVGNAGACRVRLISEPDGVVEAIVFPGRPFVVGVQWHPERMPGERGAGPLGLGLFRRLVEAARGTVRP